MLAQQVPTRALKVAGYRGSVAKLGVVAYLDEVLELERAAVQPVEVPDDNGIDAVLANVGDEALVLWPRRAAVRTDVVVGVDIGDVPAPRFGQGPAVLELASNAGSLALPIVTDSGVACGPFHYAPSTTLARGTGSCAAVAASIARGDVTSDTVRVRLPGGTLVVRPRGDRYELAGPADYVFTGQTT